MSDRPRVPLSEPSREGATRPLRVLTLTPFYPSEQDATNGCFIAEAVHALTSSGIANTVFAVAPFYRGRVRALRNEPAEWMRYISFPGGMGLPAAGAFVFARIVGRVRELQKTKGIDLIHAHGPLPCGHAAMLLRRELGIPYVVSVHGLDAFSTEQVRGRAGQWCGRITRRVFASSRRVICISERVREQVLAGMEGQTENCRTSVVYNGVDADFFSPGEERQPDLNILSVGNLIPIKAHDVLIRAIASLSQEYPALKLEVIGDGPELSRLKNLANELRVSDRVHFLGRQGRGEVVAAMRRCMIFALPSRYEGLGCVYLEAMAVAKPVIGCRGQGIAEVIQHGSNGLLVGVDNDRELALALAMLFRDESRRRNLGQTARETIFERFTLTEQAERFARIYRECVR